MNFIKQTELSHHDKIQVLELWNREYPEKLVHSSLSSFEDYLGNMLGQTHILMVDDKQIIKGWYFDFICENEKWFAIILDSGSHGVGLGTKLLNMAKKTNSEMNGWVIDHNTDRKKNGDAYMSPLNFYLKNGFEVLSEDRMELDIISAVRIKWKK